MSMLPEKPKEAYTHLQNEVNDLLGFLPLVCSSKLTADGKPFLEIELTDPDERIQDSLSEVAEHLRMAKTDIKELKEIPTQIAIRVYDAGIFILGMHQVSSLLNDLVGEIALQEAFPKRGPYWNVYYVNPESDL